jgi:hypothetical protein
MKRSLALLATAAAVAVPSAAAAHGHGHVAPRAHKLHATLTPTRSDVANYGAVGGKADLLANRRNAKSSIHLRGLTPGTAYTWAVVSGSCATNTPLSGWKYRRLRVSRSGRANSTGFAKRGAFTWDSTATYAVVVYQNGEALLCGAFNAKAHPAKPNKPGEGHGHSGGHATKPHPQAPAAPQRPGNSGRGGGHGSHAG